MTVITGVRARDLMQTDVARLSTMDPIEEAVRTFDEYHISGAPVVDDSGSLVGFLSSSDVARIEHVREGHLEGRGASYDVPDDAEDAAEAWNEDQRVREDYSTEVLGRELVQDWMTPEVISVTPDTTLKELCQIMAREGIHRVLVVDGKRLSGIVSTFDVVRYLANSPEDGE